MPQITPGVLFILFLFIQHLHFYHLTLPASLYCGDIGHLNLPQALSMSSGGSAHVSCQWGRVGNRWLLTEEGVWKAVSEQQMERRICLQVPEPASSPVTNCGKILLSSRLGMDHHEVSLE